jgi:hypothetical protein
MILIEYQSSLTLAKVYRMKQLLLLAAIAVSFVSNAQTTHAVCVEEPASTTCPGKTGTFTPGNLVIQQGDMIEFTTTTVLLGGYSGTNHTIEFTGSAANNVTLPVSSTVFPPSAQVTTVTTPPLIRLEFFQWSALTSTIAFFQNTLVQDTLLRS